MDLFHKALSQSLNQLPDRETPQSNKCLNNFQDKRCSLDITHYRVNGSHALQAHTVCLWQKDNLDGLPAAFSKRPFTHPNMNPE